MAKQYIHVWEDDKLWIQEQELVLGSLENAISQYHQELGYSNYTHTIVMDLEAKTFSHTNIEQLIQEQEGEREEERKNQACAYERLTGHELGLCAGRV